MCHTMLAVLFFFPIVLISSTTTKGFIPIRTEQHFPVEIEADKNIEWDRNANLLIASGKARLIYQDITVLSDVLIAHYRSSLEKSKIFKLEARGHACVTSVSEIACGEIVDYNMDIGLLRLTGYPARIETSSGILTARGFIEYYKEQKTAIAYGDVYLATPNGRRLSADIVTVDLAKEKRESFHFSRLQADGNIRLETRDEVIQSQHGVYDLQKCIAVLAGTVEITYHDSNKISGSYAIIDFKNGYSWLYSRDPKSTEKIKIQEHALITLSNR